MKRIKKHSYIIKWTIAVRIAGTYEHPHFIILLLYITETFDIYY